MSNEFWIIALAIFVPALLLWAIFVMRTGGVKGRRPRLGIPAAMRPGEPDEVLEGPRLERIQWMGFLASAALAIFIPLYWIPEASRQADFEARFEEEALERGKLIFAVPPPLPEDADPQEFKEKEHAIALGMGCANCHGGNASGGEVPGGFTDPVTGKFIRYVAPPLDNVFQRWDEEVVRFTIERGRPGTPMPTWGVAYGGPMTEQMVDDVMLWLKTLPGNKQPPEGIDDACQNPQPDDLRCGQQIWEARCVVCHGPQGQGKEENGLSPGQLRDLIEEQTGEPFEGTVDLNTIATEFPELFNEIGIWYPGMALWEGDVLHLPEYLHEFTIRNGRRFAFMPQFAEAPTQGIPVPPFPLTDRQIRAVMNYEREVIAGGGDLAPGGGEARDFPSDAGPTEAP